MGKADDEPARDSGRFSESAILWVSARPEPEPKETPVTGTIALIALLVTAIAFAIFGIAVARGTNRTEMLAAAGR